MMLFFSYYLIRCTHPVHVMFDFWKKLVFTQKLPIVAHENVVWNKKFSKKKFKKNRKKSLFACDGCDQLKNAMSTVSLFEHWSGYCLKSRVIFIFCNSLQSIIIKWYLVKIWFRVLSRNEILHVQKSSNIADINSYRNLWVGHKTDFNKNHYFTDTNLWILWLDKTLTWSTI